MVLRADVLAAAIDSVADGRPMLAMTPRGPLLTQQRVREIIDWGARFDKDPDGDYALGKEGGHSESRILHYKDVTGKEIERALLEAVKKRSNITIINHCFVIDDSPLYA